MRFHLYEILEMANCSDTTNKKLPGIGSGDREWNKET